MAVGCGRAYGFGRGTDYAEHAAVRVEEREVVLLYGAEGLGRCGVAGKDDELAAAGEEVAYGLEDRLP